jgi:hypothetical protein
MVQPREHSCIHVVPILEAASLRPNAVALSTSCAWCCEAVHRYSPTLRQAIVE